MTRIAFVTQRLDEADPVLGSVPQLVRALSERTEGVLAIANEVALEAPAFPSNVEVASLGKELGAGRIARGLRYERVLSRSARRGAIDALLAHMCPEYLNLAIPVARRRRIPLLLWFAHPSTSTALRVADAAAAAILTSLPGAYPLPSPKVRVIGQAVDARGLAPCPPEPIERPLRVAAVGRTSPSKGFDTVIRAAASCRSAGLRVAVRIVGPSVTSAEERHRDELIGLVRELDLEAAVDVRPGGPPSLVRETVCWSDVLVNAMVAGSGDKVVFEAAALRRPVLVSNPAFADLLGELPLDLSFPEGDADALAARLGEIAEAPPSVLRGITDELRARVQAAHSLDHWADAVVAVVRELGRSREAS
jgi:glycosyltransferase involved in cell wall biosynthesis